MTVDFIATEGLKFLRAPLEETDEIGATEVLADLQKVNDALGHGGMKVPELLRSMADQGQKFYRDGQTNPWVVSFVARGSHARD